MGELHPDSNPDARFYGYVSSAKQKATKHRIYLRTKDKVIAARHARRLEMAALLNAIKSVPCADCAGTFNPVCMDFDHRPGEKKLFQISSARDMRVDTVRAEMAKCDVVCSNCHRLRTHTRGQYFGRAGGRP